MTAANQPSHSTLACMHETDVISRACLPSACLPLPFPRRDRLRYADEGGMDAMQDNHLPFAASRGVGWGASVGSIVPRGYV